jgi:hypothetical protein
MVLCTSVVVHFGIAPLAAGCCCCWLLLQAHGVRLRQRVSCTPILAVDDRLEPLLQQAQVHHLEIEQQRRLGWPEAVFVRPRLEALGGAGPRSERVRLHTRPAECTDPHPALTLRGCEALQNALTRTLR